jgi:hypothetical protein
VGPADSARLPVLRSLPVPDPSPRPLEDLGGPGQGVLDLDGLGVGMSVGLAAGTTQVAGTTQPSQESDPRTWAAQFALTAYEVSIGHRSPSQLVRWTSERVQAVLERRHRLAGPRPTGGVPSQARVLVVRTCRSGDGSVEAAAVLTHRGRIRAMALRMSRDGERWRVVALEIG